MGLWNQQFHRPNVTDYPGGLSRPTIPADYPGGLSRRTVQEPLLIIPAPTVTPVASSMRMNDPVVRFLT